jgi:dephospho-CoA kinase
MMNRILALSGMPGSGKSIVAKIASELGLPIQSCGDIVREAAIERGLECSAKILGRLMFELREVEGEAIVAKRMKEKIQDLRPSKIVIEGVRSLAEIEEFKREWKITILAIHASPKTRFHRLLLRNRSDDPTNIKMFKERDLKELEIGIGNVISQADIMIVNESSVKAVKKEVNNKISRWMKCEYKSIC